MYVKKCCQYHTYVNNCSHKFKENLFTIKFSTINQSKHMHQYNQSLLHSQTHKYKIHKTLTYIQSRDNNNCSHFHKFVNNFSHNHTNSHNSRPDHTLRQATMMHAAAGYNNCCQSHIQEP